MSQDLGQYESNPDELEVDEENVEALINQMDEGVIEDPAPKDADDKESAADASTKQDEAIQPEPDPDKDKAADETPVDETPAKSVVKSRDGTHEIPYSVLASERAKSSALQKELDEIKAAQALHEQANANQGQADTGTSTEIDEEDLAQFEEEFGVEAATAERKRREHYAALEKRQKVLEERLAKQDEQERQDAEDRRAAVAESVNEAIESIPTLKQWRDSKDPMWDVAIALDNTLMKSPDFQGKSLQERFEVVVGRLTGQMPEPKTKTNDGENLDDVLSSQEASARRAPSSLSDLPGGAAADQSEHDTLERLTPTQLEAKFENMTEIQQAEYLARL